MSANDQYLIQVGMFHAGQYRVLQHASKPGRLFCEFDDVDEYGNLDGLHTKTIAACCFQQIPTLSNRAETDRAIVLSPRADHMKLTTSRS